MSPKSTHKGPQRKPSSDMASVLQRRRDGNAASGGGAGAAEEHAAGALADAAAAEPDVSPALADKRAADVVAAASSVGEGARGEGQGLQLIGQELVPVSEPKESEKAVEGGQKERTPEDQFASPKVQRPLGNCQNSCRSKTLLLKKRMNRVTKRIVLRKRVWL